MQDMMGTCSIDNFEMWRKKDKKKHKTSALSNRVRQAFDIRNGELGDEIASYNPGHRSMVYYFAQVYTPEELATLTITSNNTRYLDIVQEDRPEFVKAPRVNETILTETCSTALAGAMEANSGFTFPVLTIKAGIEADYDGSTSHSLNLIRTEFRSPIWEAYTHAEKAKQSPFHAAMTFALWYIDNPDRIDAKNMLLKAFEGAAAFQTSGMKRRKSLSGDAAYDVSVPFLGGSSGKANASNYWITDLGQIKYGLAIQKNNGKLRISDEELPSIADIVRTANQYAKVTLNGSEDAGDYTLYNRQPINFTLELSRLPARLCRGDWKLVHSQLNTSTGKIELNSPTSKTGEDLWPTCSFPVTFHPSSTMSLKDDHTLSLALEFDLKSALGNAGSSLGAQTISLEVPSIALKALTKPSLARLFFNREPEVTATSSLAAGSIRTTLQWKGEYQLEGSEPLPAKPSADTSGLSYDCGIPATSPDWYAPSIASDITANGSVTTLNIVLNGSWDGDYAKDLNDSEIAFTQCLLKGNVGFTLKDGQTVKREFQTTAFRYPYPAPEPAEAPAAEEETPAPVDSTEAPDSAE